MGSFPTARRSREVARAAGICVPRAKMDMTLADDHRSMTTWLRIGPMPVGPMGGLAQGQ